MKKILCWIAIVGSMILGVNNASAVSSTDLSQYTISDPVFHLDNKVVLGRVESVYYSDITPLKAFPYVGKVDTGADTTSMHAEEIQVTSSKPKYQGMKGEQLMKQIVADLGGVISNEWKENFGAYDIQGVVEFIIRHPETGEKIQQQRPLARISVIRSRTSSTPIYRPVIAIPLTIADTTVVTEVNLTDRSHFSAPILIGKSFLKQNAWVAAGYDYLQQQPQARVIGRKEVVKVGHVEMAMSASLTNRYSQMHAQNIGIDEKKRLVKFDSVGIDGRKTSMSLPLLRMLKVNGKQHPLVYVPIKANNFEKHILVYLRDRSQYQTQIRLGVESLSQHFVLHSGLTNQLKSGSKTFKRWMSNKAPLVVSLKETIKLDGYRIKASPSLAVKTSVLYVDDYQLKQGVDGQEITFKMPNEDRTPQEVTKPVVKNIVVGKHKRPVVEGLLSLGEKPQKLQFAIEKLSGDKNSYFAFGSKAERDGIVINTRSDHLLSNDSLYAAGYIEKATIEGMSFPVKLDTGADITAISATNIRRFTEAGLPMVRFDYSNDLGQKVTFTREVIDVMQIRAKSGEQSEERPVVLMEVSLGSITETVAVSLQDRTRFKFSMILGKNFLKHGILVSSDEQFLLTDK